jgi:hypothetical protein
MSRQVYLNGMALDHRSGIWHIHVADFPSLLVDQPELHRIGHFLAFAGRVEC